MKRYLYSELNDKIKKDLVGIDEFIIDLKKERLNFIKLYEFPIIEELGNFASGEILVIKLAPFLYIDYVDGYRNREHHYFKPMINFVYEDVAISPLISDGVVLENMIPEKVGNTTWTNSVEIDVVQNSISLKLNVPFIVRYSNTQNILQIKSLDNFLAQNFWKFLNPVEFVMGFGEIYQYFNSKDLDHEFEKIWSIFSSTYKNFNISSVTPPDKPQGMFADLKQQNPRFAHKYCLWTLKHIVERYLFDEPFQDCFPDDHPFKTEGPVHYLEKFKEEII